MIFFSKNANITNSLAKISNNKVSLEGNESAKNKMVVILTGTFSLKTIMWPSPGC